QFEPLPRGSGVAFVNAVKDAAFIEHLPGVEQGLHHAVQNGVIAGFPMVDIKATLLATDIHPVHSFVLAFKIATIACYREAVPKARPILLEPIMKATA